MTLNWTHYPNFTADEFACKCGCGKADMDEFFMNRVQQIRIELNKPMIVTSGFRCPAHNNRVSSSTGLGGPHTLGKAADFQCYGETAYLLEKLAHKHGMTGLGRQQHPDMAFADRFIHLDCLSNDESGGLRPRVWSY